MAWCSMGLVRDPTHALVDGETQWAAAEDFGHGN